MKDLKILNAKIPCFDTNQWRNADLLIDQGRIEKIGMVTEDTRTSIDATGNIVSPGFIDIHAHEDPVNAGAYAFFTSQCELRMGVTTKIGGNCGDSHDALADFCANLKKNGSPTNYMMFVGQNFLRMQAGARDRYAPSSRLQIQQMKTLLSEARAYAPVGLSCGFEYAPGVTTEETIELLKGLEQEGYLVSVHFRKDGPDSVESIKELMEINKETGYGIQMSHLGSCSAVGYMTEAISTLRMARARGVDITADCYPYTAFCTGIGTAVFDEGCFEKWGKDYSAIQLTAGAHRNQRCTKELYEKIRKEEPDMSVIAFVMNEEEVEQAYLEPYVMVGSDCGFNGGCGHPRGAGTYPRILSRYVREKKLLSTIEALRKMTLLPAQRLNLKTKGEIKEGWDGDLVIFNENTICDRADFANPTEAPEGIAYVLVNGQIAVKDQLIINSQLGRYIPYQNRT